MALHFLELVLDPHLPTWYNNLMINILKALVLIALLWAFLPVVCSVLNCVGYFFFQMVDILQLLPTLV